MPDRPERPTRPTREKWQAPGHDAVLGVLDALRVRGHVYCRTEMLAPWGIAFPQMPRAHFHVIEHGPCWLRVEGVRQAIPLATGDLILLPRGSAHSLGDSARSRTVPIDDLVGTHPTDHAYAIIRGGSSRGAQTRFVCGQFSFDDAQQHPLIAQLPPVIHLQGHRGTSQPWLKRTLQFLTDETRHARPGTPTIVSRLTDIIFVQALRVWIEAGPSTAMPWLRAVRDRRIGVALDRIHRAPASPWTLASLAAEAAMSRSSFAARFRALVGEPPLTYLTRWRMLSATTWLRATDLTIADIAERSGYQSEAAFTKAFKRQFGMSPSLYRRRTAP